MVTIEPIGADGDSSTTRQATADVGTTTPSPVSPDQGTGAPAAVGGPSVVGEGDSSVRVVSEDEGGTTQPLPASGDGDAHMVDLNASETSLDLKRALSDPDRQEQQEAEPQPASPKPPPPSSVPHPPPQRLSSSPKRSYRRKPPQTLKVLKEENSLSMLGENCDLSAPSIHSRGNLSDEKLQEIRQTMQEQTNNSLLDDNPRTRQLMDDDSDTFSISSVPCTQQEKRISRHSEPSKEFALGVFDDSDHSHDYNSIHNTNKTGSGKAPSIPAAPIEAAKAKRMSFQEQGRSNSAKSLTGFFTGKSSSSSGDGGGGKKSKMWQGLKNRVKRARRVGSRSRSPNTGKLSTPPEEQQQRQQRKYATSERSDRDQSPVRTVTRAAQSSLGIQNTVTASVTTNNNNNSSSNNNNISTTPTGSPTRKPAAAAGAAGGGGRSPRAARIGRFNAVDRGASKLPTISATQPLNAATASKIHRAQTDGAPASAAGASAAGGPAIRRVVTSPATSSPTNSPTNNNKRRVRIGRLIGDNAATHQSDAALRRNNTSDINSNKKGIAQSVLPSRMYNRSRSASPSEFHRRPSQQNTVLPTGSARHYAVGGAAINTNTELTEEELEQLEQVGKALKDGLTYTTITDRMKKKTYDRCFDGSAAVDFLCNYMRLPRPEALTVGRELVRHFGLFINASGAKFHSHNGTTKSAMSQHNSFMLQDSTTAYYRMVAFLPSEVKRMNMMTKVRIFEEGVKVKTRRQGLRKHKKCFVGAEAVTFLVRSRIVKTRAEALALGRQFITQFNLFEPVNRIHDFIDSRIRLYRFVEKKNRYFAINNMLSTRLIQMGREESDLSNEDDGGSSIGGKSSVSGSTVDSDEDKEDPDVSAGGGADGVDGGSDEGHDHNWKEHQKLLELADIMERGIKVTDNTKKAGKKGVSYKDTFIAARAVTFMVTSGMAENREEATALGRKLERELNLFNEVAGKHDFSDTNHYFRFTDKKDRFLKPVRTEKALKEVAEMFEQGVKVKDNTYRLRSYKKTFVGSRAVDFLVNSRLASDRANAVRLGSQLVAEFNLFERVLGNKEFSDDQHSYFRFTPLDKRKTPVSPAKPRRRSGRAFLLNRSVESRATLQLKHIPDEMLRNAEAFLNGVKVKEHKFRAKPYRATFVGSDAVSFMVNSSLAKSRKEAVDLGKQLTVQVGLFLGIDGKRDFKDDYLLYRFSQQFEEQLHGSSDNDNTPLKGLISGVSGGANVKSLPLEKIAEAFRNGVKVDDHKEKKGKEKKTLYKDTFLGSEAVDFLVGVGISESRVEAVDLGRSIAREFSLFEHVRQDCEFEDEEFLYRFCYDGEIRPLEVIEIEMSRLVNIAKDFELCVKTKTNKFRLRKYNNTFLGTEGVDYLFNSGTASSRKEAVQIGRAITKEFNLFEHVTNDRKFEDSNIPFFFVKNDERYKGLNLEKKRARRNIFANSDDDDSESAGSNNMGDSSAMNQSGKSINLTFDTEDAEWANKMASFERRMHSTQNYISTTNFAYNQAQEDESSVSSSEIRREEMHKKFYEWACKFHRLDPRYQIRYFFDFVAQDGAEHAETQVMDADNMRALYNFLPSRAQVFTVWRPTSADAIRKMMLGEAVGKGLDIKGKSAKRGKLSGFVPFLQIGENKHKSKIRPPSKEGVVRIFYPAEARRGRDLAAEKLERVALEMIETVEAAKKILDSNESSKSARKDALESMLLDMGPDPSIEYLDDYAPTRYGLEIPERLFWEAFFNQQDITRKAGSEYDGGRPSQPAFQDMNFAAIRAEPKEDAPRAVVYQGADPDSPMNPFELLVAYEENGRVMPVVSDFDCFLVGTKRVSFDNPLPPEQLDVLKWYVKEIENVMKTSKVGDSWTVNWLEILKKAAREGFYPEMPRFGFGDPKSYSIMKNAVSRLSHSGAVRHGAECFNYYFPQDLDDEFLVIANDLPDNKPWAYVDVEGLQDILEQKIEQGFTFPLNPKWVLCDAFRWKELYDKLLLSPKQETQQSMRVWFPPDSGLREIIERVHESRPSGFYKGDNKGIAADSDSDSDADGGAGAKETMMSTVVALRMLEKFQQRTKQYQSSGAESNNDDSDSD